MPPKANLSFPTRYRLGCGRRAELAAEARVAGITRALIVSDPGVAALPWFAPMCETAQSAGLALRVFAAISSNPTEVEVVAGVAAYRDGGCDGVIAVGGGSAMDAGKAIALLSGHPDGGIADYQFGGAKARAIRGEAIPPIIAVPTTSGTGSELSTGAVVTDKVAQVKRTLLHAKLMPAAVIADPETTFALPAHLTAATGMDALTHCIEALCAPGYHPMCDAIAIEGVRLIAAALPRAVRQPDDAAARTDLLMAAGMGAVAFQKGLGLVHAMAHPLGATTDLHHGLANAILLPYVLDANRDAIGPACRRLAQALALPLSGETDSVDAVLGWLAALRRDLALPDRLPPLDPALIPRLAELAMNEALYLATNPRPVDRATVEQLYRRAAAGPAPGTGDAAPAPAGAAPGPAGGAA